MPPITGGCLCGAIRLVASGPPLRVGICHCPDCRRHHGAVFYAAAIFPEAAVAIQGDPSHDRGRYFCPVCGASVCAIGGDEIEVHLGTLDTPGVFVQATRPGLFAAKAGCGPSRMPRNSPATATRTTPGCHIPRDCGRAA